MRCLRRLSLGVWAVCGRHRSLGVGTDRRTAGRRVVGAGWGLREVAESATDAPWRVDPGCVASEEPCGRAPQGVQVDRVRLGPCRGERHAVQPTAWCDVTLATTAPDQARGCRIRRESAHVSSAGPSILCWSINSASCPPRLRSTDSRTRSLALEFCIFRQRVVGRNPPTTRS